MAVREDQLPGPAFAEIAFAGRSNVGKSSLINRLLSRRRLVRTSARPGATRGLCLVRATLAIERGGSSQRASLDLVDLPGYGFARRSKEERRAWQPMVEGYLERRVGLRAVVAIVDVRRGLEPDDRQLLEFLDHLGKPAILVATKIDLVPSTRRLATVARLAQDAGRPVVGVSAETGEGCDRLWNRLLAAAGLGAAPGDRPDDQSSGTGPVSATESVRPRPSR